MTVFTKKAAAFREGRSSWQKPRSSGRTSALTKLLCPVSWALPPRPHLLRHFSCLESLSVIPSLGSGMLLARRGQLCYQTHHWGGHSLPQLTKATVGSRLYTLWPGVPTGPMAQSCSLPPQHGPAAQTAARYYSVVAWIPLNACQSAQRAESELFKLHLLKDPWCLFLLFVFSNSLKS